MNHTKTFLLWLVVALALLTGCRQGAADYDPRLVVADSVLRQDPDSALAMLRALDARILPGDGDRAYYALLLTLAQYRCYVTATSDSLINSALEYYRLHSGEQEKLTRAYIYKGAVMEELGQPEEAMTYYKHALAHASPSDAFNQGYARLRLGNIYRDHLVADSSDITLFKEALDYFKMVPDSFYIMTCMAQIGNSYMKNNRDSVLSYLDRSNEMAVKLHDKRFKAINDLLIAKHKMFSDDSHEVTQAKGIACRLIAEHDSANDIGSLLMTAAFTSARLNQLDSAQMYLSKVQGCLELPEDTAFYERCQAEVAKCNSDIDRYTHHYERYDELADSLVTNAMQQRLRDVETKYDNEALKYKALKYRTNWIMSLLGTALVVSVLVIATMLLMRKLSQRKRQLQESEDTIERLRNDMARLTSLLNANQAMSSELKDTIRNQIDVFAQLVEQHSIRSTHSLKKFGDIFEKAYQVNQPDGSFWTGIRAYANSQCNDIITHASEHFPSLIDSDFNFLSLYCCELPTTVIMACMGYKEIHSVYNKKRRLAAAMSCPNGLDDYIEQFKGSRLA